LASFGSSEVGELPFVNYGDAPEHPPQFNNDELVFDLVECHSTP